ncbi:MAG: metallophosphoesterase [Pseudomonadota bacterium]
MAMHKANVVLGLLLTLLAAVAMADESARIVVVGDIHGDWDNFIQTLKDAGVVDEKERWQAGATQLVQIGDIADRGPDTRRIIEYFVKLEKQAKRKRGAVHVLIGNHEAMNIQGDLRYVHPGEYEAFVDRNSKKRQDAYYEQYIVYTKQTTPEAEWPTFDAANRDSFNKEYPLGYVEHRRAWAPTGKIGKWVLKNPTVLLLEGNLFVHAGLAPAYAKEPLSTLNTRVRTELADPNALTAESIVNAPDGPLWSRSAATGAENATNELEIDGVLATYDAKRMIIGHTPRVGTVLPRFNSKVINVDVGMSKHYGGAVAALEIVGDQLTLIQNGQRFAVPTDNDGVEGYLRAVSPLVAEPRRIERYIEQRRAAAEEIGQTAEADAAAN